MPPRSKSSTNKNDNSGEVDDVCRLTLYSLLRWLIAIITTLYLAPLHLSFHAGHSTCQSTGFMGCCCLTPACLNTFLSSLFAKESICKAWSVFLDKPAPILRHSAVVNLVIALVLVRIRGKSRLLSILKALVATAIGTVVLHVTAILYGANLFKYSSHLVNHSYFLLGLGRELVHGQSTPVPW